MGRASESRLSGTEKKWRSWSIHTSWVWTLHMTCLHTINDFSHRLCEVHRWSRRFCVLSQWNTGFNCPYFTPFVFLKTAFCSKQDWIKGTTPRDMLIQMYPFTHIHTKSFPVGRGWASPLLCTKRCYCKEPVLDEPLDFLLFQGSKWPTFKVQDPPFYNSDLHSTQNIVMWANTTAL